MPVDVVMPKLGLTMASGTIARWMKLPGDRVRAGEPLVEVSTDKITYEVEAPATGTLGAAIAGDGDEFACGAVIGTIALPDEADVVPVTNGAARIVEAPRISAAANGAPAAAASSPERNDDRSGTRTIASPAARRLARERGVSLASVRGTGPRGRITLADVPSSMQRTPQPGDARALPAGLAVNRHAIYRKMTEVGLLPLPQVETAVRVDAVKALMELRGDFGWTAYATFAVARLLRTHPELRTDATTGAPFAHIDIGIAADTPHGLIVPVVRAADTRSLAEIHAEIARLAAHARAGTLTAADVGNASFSISNVGPQGIDRVAPLPDPPQTAILGIGAVTQRPHVENDTIVPAWTLTCVLTFDHRHIDGAPAARFLAALAQTLTTPGALL